MLGLTQWVSEFLSSDHRGGGGTKRAPGRESLSLRCFLRSRGVDAHPGPDRGGRPAGVLLHPGPAHPGRSGVPGPPLAAAAVCRLRAFPHLFPLFLVRLGQSGWGGAPGWPTCPSARPGVCSDWDLLRVVVGDTKGGARGTTDSHVCAWLWEAPGKSPPLARVPEQSECFRLYQLLCVSQPAPGIL